MSDPRAALRLAVVAATFKHVPFDGWTWAALERGARDLGRSAADARRAFPDGPAEAIAFASREADARLSATDFTRLRTRERVAEAVLARLEMARERREALRRTLAYLALPLHAPLGAKLLWNTADAIWRASGDRSTDFSWYTKRATLAGVYASTLLVWLDDTSADLAVTRAFLDFRIEDVMRIGRVRARLSETAAGLANAASLLGRLRRVVGG